MQHIARHLYLCVFLWNALLIYFLSFGEIAFASRYYPLLIGCVFAQLGLVAIWGGVAIAPAWLRLPICFLATWLTYRFLAPEDPHHFFWAIYLAILVFVYPVFWMAGAILGRLEYQSTDTDQVGNPSESTQHFFQFSIGRLMELTTVSIFLIILINSELVHLREAIFKPSYVAMSVAAVLTAYCVGATLYIRRFWITLGWTIASVGGAFVLGMVVMWFIHRIPVEWENVWHFGAVYVSEAAVMLLTVWAVRFCGFQKRAAPTNDANSN